MAARMRSSDDLPEPEGPTTALTAAAGKVTSMPLSAFTSPVGVQ